MSLSVDAVDIKKRIESCKNLQEVEGIRRVSWQKRVNSI